MHFKENETIYTQIERYIKKRIFKGEYRPGLRLPAIRELALALSVNPNTVVKAYAELEAIGLIFSERTNGKFVTEDYDLINAEKAKFIKCEVKEFIGQIKGMTESEQEIINYIKGHYDDI